MKKMTIEAWKKCPVCGKTENQVRAGIGQEVNAANARSAANTTQ